ncbi:MAG: hypothetical protein P3A28_09995 [Gemmatimonadota bacterium]|nr:hypothetical protein [Gemmatimonadota bacterium]
MTGSITISLFAAALAATSPLHAAHDAAVDSTRVIVRAASVTTDSIRIAESLRRASSYAAAGRMAEARREYRSLISIERAEGSVPSQALWLLANAYFADDNLSDAASTLDRLADDARDFIDPATELPARLEAAILWAKVRRFDRARDGLARVRLLLRSPAISATQRSWALSRLGE